MGSQVTYPRERWAAAASYSSTLSASTGATASARNQLDVDAFRLLRWNNWFYEGLATFLQSSEQGISLQTTAGGGIGRYLKSTNRARISLLAGFAVQNTDYQQNIGPQNLASGLNAAKLQFFRFNKTNADVTTALLPVISQPGRVKLTRTRPITLSSPVIYLGISRSTATGTAGRRIAFRAATTAPARDSAGHLVTSDMSLGSHQE